MANAAGLPNANRRLSLAAHEKSGKDQFAVIAGRYYRGGNDIQATPLTPRGLALQVDPDVLRASRNIMFHVAVKFRATSLRTQSPEVCDDLDSIISRKK